MSRHLLLLAFICILSFITFSIVAPTSATQAHEIVKLESIVSSTNFTAPRSVSACGCDGCKCNVDSQTEVCPVSVPVSQPLDRTVLCSKQRVRVLSVRVDSPDRSKFRVYGLDQANYNKFTQGQSFGYYAGISTPEDSECSEKTQPVIVDTQYLHFVFKCVNWMENCKIRFDIKTDCVAGPATAIDLQLSKTLVYTYDTFSATATLRDATGAIDVFATDNIYLSIYESSTVGGSLLGTVSAPASNGVAHFPNLKFSAAGTYKIRAQYGSVVTISSQIDFVEQVVASIDLFHYSFKIRAHDMGAFSGHLATCRDRKGDRVFGMPGGVLSFTKQSGPGQLVGTTSIQVPTGYHVGVFEYPKFAFDEPGDYVITVSFDKVFTHSKPIKVITLGSMIVYGSEGFVGEVFSVSVFHYDNNGESMSWFETGCETEISLLYGPGELHGNRTQTDRSSFKDLYVDMPGKYKIGARCGSVTGESEEFVIYTSNGGRSPPSYWMLAFVVAIISLLLGSNDRLL